MRKESISIPLQKQLYFYLVLLIELAIFALFIWFLVYLFPTLSPEGYQYFGDAPHVPYLEQNLSHTLLTVVRWLFFLATAGLILPMMATILMELVRWQINYKRHPAKLPPNDPTDQQITRFENNFKIQHYLIMIGVTLAGIIGLSQAFPDWSISRWFIQDLWGLETGRKFHHYFAYIADFTVFYFLIYLAYKFFIKKEKLKAMIPTLKDAKDFLHMNLYILGIKKEEPQYGRFTFGQKLDFYIILLGIPTLSITGLAMHYTWISDNILPPVGIALAAIIHRSVALFLAWFVLSVHLYYAHFAPDLFPVNTVILTGKMAKSRYQALFPLDKERLGDGK